MDQNNKKYVKIKLDYDITQRINKDELLNEIRLSFERDELTPRAVEIFYLMTKKIVSKLRYKYYEDQKDSIMFAMEDIFKRWRNFDIENHPDKIFSYYTQIIKNGLAAGWKKLHPVDDSKVIYINSNNIYSV